MQSQRMERNLPMKFQRFMGWLFLCVGIMGVLIAFVALVLPMIDNDQVRLILSSLEVPSRSQVANWLNQAMLFILRNQGLLLGAGAGLVLVGSLLLYSAIRRSEQGYYEPSPISYRNPYTVLDDTDRGMPAEPDPRRRPAYLSDIGDAAPPPVSFARQPNPYRAYGSEKPYSWLNSTPAESPDKTAAPATAPLTPDLSQTSYQRPQPSSLPQTPPPVPEVEPPVLEVEPPVPVSVNEPQPFRERASAKAPDLDSEAVIPRYLSPRIRSTMKRKTY